MAFRIPHSQPLRLPLSFFEREREKTRQQNLSCLLRSWTSFAQYRELQGYFRITNRALYYVRIINQLANRIYNKSSKLGAMPLCWIDLWERDYRWKYGKIVIVWKHFINHSKRYHAIFSNPFPSTRSPPNFWRQTMRWVQLLKDCFS